MYKRFLNNADYIGVLTEEAIDQLTRGNEDRLVQAEEEAEVALIEYLTENYEIEKTLEVGKNLLPYNKQTTYPVGSHFYNENRIVEAIRVINGCKAPMLSPYWEEYTDRVDNPDELPFYSQTKSYVPGDIVRFGAFYYKCLQYNGLDYKDIRIPGINAWEEVTDIMDWEANVEYDLWHVTRFDNNFYALINIDEDIDLTVNPYESDYWGLIGAYDSDYEYELSDHEYVVSGGRVFYPTMNPNRDTLQMDYNIKYGDPRNGNVKKQMLRMAVYFLHLLISPNNVSTARITEYNAAITWLQDANRLKINPQIPRKVDEDKKPVADFAVATFMRDYDPNNNPWQI